MASDNEASCVSDPNFAVICSFLECFGKSCGIEYPDIAMLQEMVENAQEVPQQLIDLHVKLLRKTRKTVSAEKWERALVKFCHTYSNQDGWELERFGYKKARIAVKLRLLKVLLEAQFDMNTRFKNEVNKLAANELRVEPLGRDKSGLAYWCQLDEDCNIRVYREDLDEESWELVAKDRDGVVGLISTLSNGEAGDIPLNEDSNSLEISEKPIIDTGQVTSSPSLEDENREEVTNGVEASKANGKPLEDGDSVDEDLEDEEEDEEDDEEADEDEQGEEEEEEEGEIDEEEEEEDGDEEGDLSNDESSQQNTDDEEEEEDSQDANIPQPESVNKKIIQLENLSKQGVVAALPIFESKKLVSNPETPEIPISVVNRGKKMDLSTETAAVNPQQRNVEIGKHISEATTVIKTSSPIKVVNISELTKPTTIDERKLDVKVPIGITLTPVTKQITRENITEIVKPRERTDNTPSKSNIFYSSSSNESTTILPQNKISLKPIDKLAANLVKLQSEKLEKPGGMKSLAKIAENLARSNSIHGVITSPDEDRQIPDFFPRNQLDKSSNQSRSQRGMDLSTSPRGWESLGERSNNRPVDFSGIDLSSRKSLSKSSELNSPTGYNRQPGHDFQHKEIDLSTRKPARSDLSNIPYDARTLSRSHSMIADLSKRQVPPPSQLPFTGYELPPPAYRNSVDHRLPNYGVLTDPNKMNSARLDRGIAAKRALEEDDVPHDINKRIHVDVIPIKGNIDRRQIITSSNNWRDEVGEAIQEPVMNIQGEGSGSDCDAVNPEIGEAIDEPVLYFYGQGLGCESETGNPSDETNKSTDDNEDNSKESKNDKNLNLTDKKISVEINPENEITLAKDSGAKTSENFSQPGTSSAENSQALEEICMESTESDKTKFKPTLGVQVFTKSSGGGSPVKRLSRWDVRRPTEKTSNEHDDDVVLSSGVVEDSKDTEEKKNSEHKLSTIKESTTEVDVEAEITPDNDETETESQSCDIITKSDDNSSVLLKEFEKPEGTTAIEEPCRHDSSNSIGAGLFKAIIPGLLAVPGAENLAEKQNEIMMESLDNNADLSSEKEGAETSDESLPRFFFGPNCVSYNLKNEEKKDDGTHTVAASVDNQSSVNVSESISCDKKEIEIENENVAKLADDLAKTVNIEKRTDSITADKNLEAETETETEGEKSTADSINQTQSLDKAIDDDPVPESVINTDEVTDDHVSEKEGSFAGKRNSEDKIDCAEKSADLCTPVNEKFEKLSVTETEITAVDKSLDSPVPSEDKNLEKSIDDTAKDETLPVSESFGKLIVSEAEKTPKVEGSTSLLSENEILEESSSNSKVETEEIDKSIHPISTNKKDEESNDCVSDSEIMDKTADDPTGEGESKNEEIKLLVTDSRGIEESRDSLNDSEDIKEPTESILEVESEEKTLDESETLKDPAELPSDSLMASKESAIEAEKVEDSMDSLPTNESIKTTISNESSNKITTVEVPSDEPEDNVPDDREEEQKLEQQSETKAQDVSGELKTLENISEEELTPDSQVREENLQLEKQEIEESEVVEQSLGQRNETELSEELPESQTISELGTSINEDELLKSSSDSEQDQNPEGEKNSLEDEFLWSSQSEAAEKGIDKKNEENIISKDVVTNKDEDSGIRGSSLTAIETRTEDDDKSESKLHSTTEESSSSKNISDLEKDTEIVSTKEGKSHEADNSTTETSIDDVRSKDGKLDATKESKEFNITTENTLSSKKPDLEPEKSVSNVDSPLIHKSGEIAQADSLKGAETPEKSIDKPSAVEKDENELPKKEEFRFNQITPTAIIDSNVSKSPERITIDSKDEGVTSALADIADDYCDPASENPSSSADQDSNEAMVIDDRLSDSNESSKDLVNEDSILNDDDVVREEKEISDPLATNLDKKNSADCNIEEICERKKKEEFCFNLKDISSSSSKQDITESSTVQIENKTALQQDETNVEKRESKDQERRVESELTEDDLLKETETETENKEIEKCTVESELEEPEDTVENLTQDTSTDDQKSLVANYDSSDRESDDVFENDLVENASQVDEFNDTASNELFLERDKEEEEEDDLLTKIDEANEKTEETDAQSLPKSKQELSINYLGESNTSELQTVNDETKRSEQCLSEAILIKENTEIVPGSNLDEITKGGTSSVDIIDSEKEKTDRVIEEERKLVTEELSEFKSDDNKIEDSIKAEDSSAPIITNVEHTKEIQASPEESFDAEPIEETDSKAKIEPKDEVTREKDSQIQEPGITEERSTEKTLETVPGPVKDISTAGAADCIEETISYAVEMDTKDTKGEGKVESGESLSNSTTTITNLEKVEEDTIDKSSENQISEKSKTIVTDKIDVVNESLSLTIAAKHSLELDTIDSNESENPENELFEDEAPVVHHSKRFKEDLSVAMLGDDKRELQVLSLFEKDLKRKDQSEFNNPGTEMINHSINFTAVSNKFEASKDPENLQTSIMEESETTILDKTCENSAPETAKGFSPKDEVDKIDLITKTTNSDIAIVSPVVTETLEIKKTPDIARDDYEEREENKKLQDISNPEKISTFKPKEMNFESLNKSNASANETVDDNSEKLIIVSPQNSFAEVVTKDIEVIKNAEPSIPSNMETTRPLDSQLAKKSTDAKADVRNDSEIQSITIESDDSMGADNDDGFCNPQDEIDPLACIDEDTGTKTVETDVQSVGALGIRVKPVSELVYEGWKLDGTETPKISRKRRNSNHESNSEDVVMKDEDDESEGTGGKRMRLRGKRPPDMNLRRTVEEKRQEAASSDDENVNKKSTELVKEESKEGGDDDVVLIDSVSSNDRKTRGRPKGKRKVRRNIRLPGRAAPTPSSETNQTPGPDSSLGTEGTETGVVLSSPAIGTDTPQKKRKKRKMVLGLEIGRDIVDTSQTGAELLNETPVRQSRRIAQIKIKEEADRRRIEEETLCELKEKKDRDVVGGGDGKKKRKKQKAESEEEEEGGEEEEREEEEEVISSKEVEIETRDTKTKKKRKKKKRKKKPSSTKFDEMNPWRSSSGSSSDDDDNNDEDDDEDEEPESEGSVLFKSDHEFSPESDLEKDEESEPLRRARTAQKAQSDVEEAEDEYACQKCGKADHPEWILLCDTCDKGWHCSCLRPALMLIPEGDWFCPPCQHNLLVLKLQENLKKYDQNTKKHENELLRKKRLAFVGISLDNVLHKNETHRSSRASSQDSDSSSSQSSSSSGSSTSEESEPVYQLRERRCANTYKFNEYDDMINAAIQDEVEAVRGAGNQGRGKDIATIVNAEKEEAQAEALMQTQQVEEEDDEEDKKVEKESDEDYKAEKDEDVDEEDEDDDTEKPKVSVKKTLSRKKHRKLNSLDISSEDDPESDEDFKGSSSDDDEDPEEQGSSSDASSFAGNRRRGGRRGGGGAPVRRSTRARMTRYDEDFINDDSDDSDKPKKKKSRSVWDESESEESDNSWRQRKKRSKTFPTPKSRSRNKAKSKKRRIKKKRVIESDNQSDNEEGAAEANAERNNEPEDSTLIQPVPNLEPGNENEAKNPIQNENQTELDTENIEKREEQQEVNKYQEGGGIPSIQTAEEEKLAKKKKESTPRRKKTPPIRRKIVYGGLQDSYPKEEEETLGRRTRGKKINYQEVLASDSEEELKKALKKTEESEDEFVVNEVEDLNEEAEKDSDSGDIYSPKKEGPKLKGKSPKGKKPRKSKSPGSNLTLTTSENETPKSRKKPGPKPGSKNRPRSQKMTPPFGSNPRSGGEEGDITEEGSLAGIGPGDLAELDEEQLDQMMMEDEEYGKRQLELAAIEIAKKKKEEREAKKLEKARLKALEILAAERQRDPNAPEGTDGEAPKKKKRGRRSKAEILAEQMRRDGAPNLSMESISSPNVTTTTALLSPSSINLPSNSSSVVMSPNLLSTPNLNQNLSSSSSSSFLNPNTGLNLTPNLTPTMVPNLSTIMTATTPAEVQKIPENLVPVIMPGDQQQQQDPHGFSPDGGMLVKPKRRGRGKGKKTLALEAARAAEAAAKGTDHISGFGTDSNPEMKSDDPHILPTPGSSTSGSAPSTPPASIVGVTQVTPSTQTQPSSTVQQSQNYPPMATTQHQPQSSVITRMLQSQPVSGGPQSFAAAAAAMGHKYFGPPNAAGNIMGVPRPGFDLQPRGRIPSPYRQPGQSPMPPHFAAVRSGTPPMRMRVPGPQLYHTPHHPMDPSPSGGGPISISSNRDRSSPLGPGPGPAMIPPAAGSPLTKSGGPTPPPPPPYARGVVPPMGRFADSSPMGGGGGPRHQMPPFTNASTTNHSLQQQASPPPNRASGNFSPYHPPPPPNYHYGAYPPPPPMTTADDAAAYQGSPYNTEHFSTTSSENSGSTIQPPPPPPPQPQSTQAPTIPHSHPHPHPHPHTNETSGAGGNKQFDEEGTGEFGGLVSYFSSQREDDLDS